MRDLALRIAIMAVAFLAALAGFVMAVVFLCVALYEAFKLFLIAPLAALAAAGAVFVLAFLIIGLGRLTARLILARRRRASRGPRGGGFASLFSAELGRILGADAQAFVADKPLLSLILAVAGGFAVGANPKLREILEAVLKA